MTAPKRLLEAAREKRGKGSGAGSSARASRSRRRSPLERLAARWQRMLEIPALWVVLFLLVGTWALAPSGLLFHPRVSIGEIADRDFLASEEILLPDEAATATRQQEARDAVLPVYDFHSGREWIEKLETLFSEGQRSLGLDTGVDVDGQEDQRGAPVPVDTVAELAETLRAATGWELAPAAVTLLVEQRFSPRLADELPDIAQGVLRRGVVANKELLLTHRMRGITVRDLDSGAETLRLDLYDTFAYPDEVRAALGSEMRAVAGLSASQRRTLVALLLDTLRPNLTINESETQMRKETAAESTSAVVSQIRRGQVIVRKGDAIDSSAAAMINSVVAGRTWIQRVLPVLGTFLLLALSAWVLWLGVRLERIADHSSRRRLSEILILLLLSLLGVRLGCLVAEAMSSAFDRVPYDTFSSYVLIVPFAALALLAMLLFGRQPAILLAAVASVLVWRFSDASVPWLVLYSFSGSLAAIFALERFQVRLRMVMTRVGLVVGAVNVVVVLMLTALSGAQDLVPARLGFDLLCALGGGLVVGAVASFALPILETLLGLTTDIKLAELANTNLPLLRRLAFEAPGSFQHSLMVANLAKQGCEQIGADAELAYTGGLYHDIGKIRRAEYFIENQRGGHNPHDGLQPSMSALILINHIKDGVDLARRHHLPPPILAAIKQHHGTRLIKYFYNRAKERLDPSTGEVSEAEFRYPGPKPRNKVMGVLMLADAVEAASRTLVEPTTHKLRSLIRRLVDDCQGDGQLDCTDLTLSDLKVVSETFLHVLSNIYHQRIDYPGFDFNFERRRAQDGPANGAGGQRGQRQQASAAGAARA